MKILLLIALLVIGETAGGRLKRLVGGSPVDIKDVPYQVSLRYDGYHICGGSLISSCHVLTAAHCVANLFDEPYDELTVVSGTNRLSTGGTVNYVKDIIWHDNFVNDLESTWKNDVAVIILRSKVDENKMQKALKLPTEEPKVRAMGKISGFGRTIMLNPFLSDILQSAETKILTSVACQEFVKNHKIRETQICGLQKKDIGVCKGDSGGPLASNGTIVGISSWNTPCGLGIPDVYTNVYRYLEFIKKVMKTPNVSCTIL